MDLVSIIIPTYNRADIINVTLESVLAQTYHNWECIIVDDGSTDDTINLINSYLRKDKRFQFFSRTEKYKKGASSCRNIGFQYANGNFIQYLDSDDILNPKKLEDQILELKSSNKNTLACSKWALFNINPTIDSKIYNLNFPDGEYSSCAFLKQMGVLNAFYPPHCYLIPTELINHTEGWNENLTNNDDAEFFTRVIIKADGIKLSSKVLAYYRKSFRGHLSNYSNPVKIESVIRSWELIKKHISKDCDESSLIYFNSGRNRLFHTLKNKYPWRIRKHKTFFENQFKEESYRLNKFFIFKKMIKNFLRTIKQQFLKN